MPTDKKKKQEDGSPVVSYSLGVASESYAIGPQPDADYTGANCLEFSGAQRALSPLITEAVETIEVTFYTPIEINSTTPFAVILGTTDNEALSVGAVSGSYTDETLTFISSSTIGAVSHITDVIPSGWHTVKLTWDGAKYAFNVDGVDRTTIAFNANAKAEGKTWELGARGSAGAYHWTGLVSNLRLRSESAVVLDWSLAEGSGLPKDTSGKGNHATECTATWATDDSIESANHKFGHTPSVVSDGSGQYIDTGISNGSLTAFKCSLKIHDYSASTVIIGLAPFGTTRSSFYVQPTGKLVCGLSSGNYSFDEVLTIGAVYDVEVDLTNSTAKINGELVGLVPASGLGHTSPNVQLFARINGSIGASCSLLSCELLNGTETVRDYIPLPDGEMFDRVSNTVVSNDGGGLLSTEYSTALNYDKFISSSLNFNGTSSVVQGNAGQEGGTAVNIKWSGYIADAGIAQPMVSCGGHISSVRGCSLYSTEFGGISFLTADGSSTSAAFTFNGAVPSVGYYDIELTWDGIGGSPSLTVNGVNKTGFGATVSWSGQSEWAYDIGSIAGSLYFEGYVSTVEVDGVFSYDFTAGTTDEAVASDLSGNGNDGSIVDADWEYITEGSAMPTKSVLTLDGVGDNVVSESTVSIDGGIDVDVTFVLDADHAADSTQYSVIQCGQSSGGSEFCVRLIGLSLDVFMYHRDLGVLSLPYGDISELKGTTINIKAGLLASAELYIIVNDGPRLASFVPAMPAYLERPVYVGSRASTTYFKGSILDAKVSTGGVEFLDYDFTDYLGKTTSRISDLSPEGNDGILTVSSSLDTIWGKRLFDPEGTVVDAESYLPITRESGYLHNGSEVNYKGLSYSELIDAQSNTTLLTRTRLDSVPNVTLYLERFDTTADPILEKFLGN